MFKNNKNKLKKPWSTKKKIIVSASVVIVLLPVILIAAFFYAFNGGSRGLKNSMTPQPNPASQSLEEKRASSLEFINNEFVQLEQNKDVRFFAVSKHDACYRGDANYKRQDNFSNKCNQKVTRFYGTNDNLKNQMIKFGKFLDYNDWKDTGATKGDTEVEVALSRFDKYYGKPHPTFGNISYAGSLPSIKGIKDEALIEMEYAEANPTGQKFFSFQRASTGVAGMKYHEVKELQDESVLYPKILSEYKYVIAVSINDIYFQN